MLRPDGRYPQNHSIPSGSTYLGPLVSRSNLPPSLYNPMPTANTMDAYGLFYIVKNADKARLGLPTANPDREDVYYTSSDPQNRPHVLPRRNIAGNKDDFMIIFTVNGPKKSDIVISYESTSVTPP